MTTPGEKTIIEVDRATVDALRARAQAQGVTLAAYLRSIAAAATPFDNGVETMEQFDRLLDELASRTPSMPSLPPDFSRADIYSDHD